MGRSIDVDNDNDDLTVIGAGHSSCAAAITCAEAGLRVPVMEPTQFPCYRLGEILHPGAGIDLEQLGILEEIEAAGFLRHAVHRIRWS